MLSHISKALLFWPSLLKWQRATQLYPGSSLPQVFWDKIIKVLRNALDLRGAIWPAEFQFMGLQAPTSTRCAVHWGTGMSPDLTERTTAHHQQSGAGMYRGEAGQGGHSNQTTQQWPFAWYLYLEWALGSLLLDLWIKLVTYRSPFIFNMFSQ